MDKCVNCDLLSICSAFELSCKDVEELEVATFNDDEEED
jgi:hypothetical protein